MKKIDTGQIILNEKIKIGKSETAGELHGQLMVRGSELVLKTVKLIQDDRLDLKYQKELVSSLEKLKPAPKIFKEDTRIDWEKPMQDVFNLIRGLSPYPAAYTKLSGIDNDSWILKIFNAELLENSDEIDVKKVFPGAVLTDNKTYLYIGCSNGLIGINELQIEGKRRMPILEFLRGFDISNEWKVGI